MKISRLLPLPLLLLSIQSSAADLEKIRAQQSQLREETRRIQEQTRTQQARLDELKRLLEAQREKSRLLDQQLQSKGVKKQQTTSPESGNKPEATD